MSLPLVSVVITSYNYARYIETAINSVLAQDYPNVEVVVTDNRSTDDTLAVLAKYSDEPRVRVNVNETNLGITRNINTGVSLARGEYVVLLSADDFLLAGHTTRLVSIAEAHPQVALVYGNAYFADISGVPYGARTVYGQVLVDYLAGRNEFPWLLAACYVCLPTVLFRKRLFEEYGMFDESLRVASDWEICLRYAAHDERFAYTTTPLAAIRMHLEQASTLNYQRSGDELQEALDIGERYLIPKHFDRFHGREMTIMWANRDRIARLQGSGPENLGQDLAARARRFEERLVEFARMPHVRIREPKIAVIISSTGRQISLARALASLDKQTYANWEAIVIQDDGFDLGPFVAMLPQGKRVRFMRTIGNLGPASVRNTGRMLVDGDYLAFLDEDNEFAPDHFATLLEVLRRDEARAAFSGTRCVFDTFLKGTLVTEPVGHTDELRPAFATTQDIEVANCVPLGACLFEMTLADELFSFDERFGLLADWEYVLRAAKVKNLAQTGRTTLFEHAVLGLQRQYLGKEFRAYPSSLELVYSTHPPSTVDVLRQRERQRERLAPLLGQVPAAFGELGALVALYGALAGLDVGKPVPA